MLKFDLTPDAFVRAALLHLRDGVEIIAGDEQTLFHPALDTDDPAVHRRFLQLLESERWGSALGEGRIRSLLFFCLRHRSRNWALMVSALAELLERGPEYLLGGAGEASHKLLAMRSQVVREIHRLTGFTRLTPVQELLVGEAPTRHLTGDLVALGLARRNPGTPLVLLTPQGDWLALKGRVRPVDGAPFRSHLDKDSFRRTWLTYYRSQFIDERNNPRHAARAIPREYWQWLAEGEELDKARRQKRE
ncbi:MAG: DUF4130 domain-containing protein [Firmicutes bacterium]|nr:DUF4130 domain-containing protein [Bacillota bacterium]